MKNLYINTEKFFNSKWLILSLIVVAYLVLYSICLERQKIAGNCSGWTKQKVYQVTDFGFSSTIYYCNDNKDVWFE